MKNPISVFVASVLALNALPSHAGEIVHDSEFYVLEEQNSERWAEEDKVLDKQLADFKASNGGKPPNIFYILIDDIGFGDLGSKNAEYDSWQ